ncbi:hypothetical protein PFISCL1PPCAC_4540, partial [Pristionchus fissidentatus]
CYEPKDCVEGANLAEVTTKLTPGCYVSFKFHPFSEFWYRIVMEGSKGKDKIELIKFNAIDDTETPIFTCERAGNIPRIISVSSSPKGLRCEFEVNLKSRKVCFIGL